MKKINKIIVLGGGTSGLTSALLLKTQFPHIDIKVIESSAVGVIGVGEGSTEHWRNFCETIGISLEDSLVECDATLKTGIKFIDWGVPDYWHATCEPFSRPFGDYLAIYAKLISDDVPPEGIVLKRIPVNSIPKDWVEGTAPCPVNQFHFNTFSTNKYLHKLCDERKIPTVDDKIVDVELDDEGYISKLIGEKDTHTADFFIDSSGFARVLMKKLGAKWESYKDRLWVNSAIAFPTEDTDEYPCYTLSTAMSAGWMWNTPVRGRWGNGYVFDDRYIDFDQAQAEVEAKLGRKVEIAKKIKFDAGKLDRAWIKNCASVGLCTSFVEPLESTAITQGILQTFMIMNMLNSWSSSGDDVAEMYNDRVNDICKNILDFIAIHYYVPKDDTPFWKDLKDNRESWMTDFLKEKIPQWHNRMPSIIEFDKKYLPFTADNWAVTLHGLKLFNVPALKHEYDLIPQYAKDYVDDVIFQEVRDDIDYPLVSHKEAVLQFVDNYNKRKEEIFNEN